MARRTVLIIDPDEDTRFLCSVLLEHRGYGVVTARDVEWGIALSRRAHPAVIVTAPLQQLVDHADIVAALKGDEATAAIPLMVLGARARPGEVRDPSPADSLLPKPVDADRFLAEIDRLCGRPAASREPAGAMASPVESW